MSLTNTLGESTKHLPVLLAETVALLEPSQGKLILDGTFGGGGHSRALLEKGAKVVAVDRDPAVKRFAANLKAAYGPAFRFENLPCSDAEKLAVKVDGAILDLGMSSDQLESLGRGFSFQRPTDPLDLRFDPSHGQTAAQLLGQSSLSKVEGIFRDLAEDRYWRRLSQKILSTRRQKPIKTVGDLVAIVGTADPKVLAPIWQGLRIAVNDELTELQRSLAAVHGLLKPGGILAVISFQSLEDRIVKQFFRERGYTLKTKKPLIPSDAELQRNARSRSAKLRAGKKK